MNLTFRLRFHTRPGQSLAIAGEHPLPGHRVPLQYLDHDHWQVSIPLAIQATDIPFTYSYIFSDHGTLTADWGRDRTLLPAKFPCSELLILDSWNDPGSVANAFDTAPFKNVLLAAQAREFKTKAVKNPTHTFRVKAPLLGKNETLCLVGSGTALGHWQTANPVLLNRSAAADGLSAQLDLRGQTFPLAYNYGVDALAQK